MEEVNAKRTWRGEKEELADAPPEIQPRAAEQERGGRQHDRRRRVVMKRPLVGEKGLDRGNGRHDETLSRGHGHQDRAHGQRHAARRRRPGLFFPSRFFVFQDHSPEGEENQPDGGISAFERQARRQGEVSEKSAGPGSIGSDRNEKRQRENSRPGLSRGRGHDRGEKEDEEITGEIPVFVKPDRERRPKPVRARRRDAPSRKRGKRPAAAEHEKSRREHLHPERRELFEAGTRRIAQAHERQLRPRHQVAGQESEDVDTALARRLEEARLQLVTRARALVREPSQEENVLQDDEEDGDAARDVKSRLASDLVRREPEILGMRPERGQQFAALRLGESLRRAIIAPDVPHEHRTELLAGPVPLRDAEDVADAARREGPRGGAFPVGRIDIERPVRDQDASERSQMSRQHVDIFVDHARAETGQDDRPAVGEPPRLPVLSAGRGIDIQPAKRGLAAQLRLGTRAVHHRPLVTLDEIRKLDCVDPRVRVDHFRHAFERVRKIGVVRIESDEPLALRLVHRAVPRDGNAAVRLMHDADARSGFAFPGRRDPVGDFRGSVRRAVVNDDPLEVAEGLGGQGRRRRLERRRPVVHGRQDRESHVVSHLRSGRFP